MCVERMDKDEMKWVGKRRQVNQLNWQQIALQIGAKVTTLRTSGVCYPENNKKQK